MVFALKRTYFPKGTNGDLWCGGQLLCHTIELPWLANKRKISCIPEGVYVLKKRYDEKFGWHLWVSNVVGRQMILIHPANNALKELKGCIAPVSKLDSAGIGSDSRIAFTKLCDLVFPLLDAGVPVKLKIVKQT